MCNCITETENKTKALLEERNPGKEILDVDIQEIGFSMKGSVTFNTVSYSMSGKKKKINIYHTFCPFCGKKYPKLS